MTTTKITFELDGKPVEASGGDDLQVAQRHGTKIPHLCWHPARLPRRRQCRACMVRGRG